MLKDQHAENPLPSSEWVPAQAHKHTGTIYANHNTIQTNAKNTDFKLETVFVL